MQLGHPLGTGDGDALEVRVRVLVVEDDAKLRALVARGLVEEGYAIDVAGTGGRRGMAGDRVRL